MTEVFRVFLFVFGIGMLALGIVGLWGSRSHRLQGGRPELVVVPGVLRLGVGIAAIVAALSRSATAFGTMALLMLAVPVSRMLLRRRTNG